MSTLVRAPEAIENSVKKSASRQGIAINTWWIEAAEEKLRREKLDVPGLAARINADPVMREVLDRLGQ